MTFIIFYPWQMDISSPFSCWLFYFIQFWTLAWCSKLRANWSKPTATTHFESVNQLQERKQAEISLIKSDAIYSTKLHSDVELNDMEATWWKGGASLDFEMKINKKQNNQKKRERKKCSDRIYNIDLFIFSFRFFSYAFFQLQMVQIRCLECDKIPKHFWWESDRKRDWNGIKNSFSRSLNHWRAQCSTHTQANG